MTLRLMPLRLNTTYGKRPVCVPVLDSPMTTRHFELRVFNGLMVWAWYTGRMHTLTGRTWRPGMATSRDSVDTEEAIVWTACRKINHHFAQAASRSLLANRPRGVRTVGQAVIRGVREHPFWRRVLVGEPATMNYCWKEHPGKSPALCSGSSNQHIIRECVLMLEMAASRCGTPVS